MLLLIAQGQTAMTPSTTPEAVPGGTLLLVAYAVAWTVVLFYVFTLWRKSKRIQDDLADVTSKLNARAGKR